VCDFTVAVVRWYILVCDALILLCVIIVY